LHNDANPVEVQKVLDQPDFARFDRQMEGEPDWFPPAIHAGGHFGIGGMLGQAGNAANSPGGALINPTSLSDSPNSIILI
jgi:tyrosinase